MFEDVEPTNKPLIEILPKIFTDAEIKSLVSEEGFIDRCSFLIKVPGGKPLYDRIKGSM